MFGDLVRDGSGRALIINPTLGHAVVSEFVQGAHCAGYSAVATMLHAPKLEAEESVHYVQDNLQAHDWSESRVPDGHHKSIVMDPWAEGPAVLASDSRFAHDALRTQERLALNCEEGKRVPNEVAENVQFLQENYSARAASHLERLRAQGFRCPPGEVWEPQPVASDAFRARVKERLPALADVSKPRGSFLQPSPELYQMAIESARSLGVSKKAATNAAEAVITAAYHLVE